MVAIPTLATDPTLEAMRAAMETRALLEPRRTYLGASSIGHSCARNLWYGYNGYASKPIESPGLMAIEDGHRTEDLIAERLRLVPGVTLWTHDENGKQFGFEEAVEFLIPRDMIDPKTGEITGVEKYGYFKGHYDGVIIGLLQAPKTPHVWENKAVNQKKFDLFRKMKNEFGEKKALKKWDYVYWAQGQIYMHKTELARHYLTVSTPGGRDVESCRTEYDKEAAIALMEKARRVIRALSPPAKIGGPTWYECKFCKFYDTCHGENK